LKLKINEQGFAEVKDGKPVYIDGQGQEIAYDVPAAIAKITELNGEAKTHRLAAKEAADKLAAFSGIEDPAAALDALQFKESMKGKKAVDDDAIKSMVAAAVKPIQEKLNAAEKVISEKDAHIYKLEVSGKFMSSPYIKDNLVLPPDIAEATFGKSFKIEGGKVTAYDSAGNQIFSKARPGEPADFEEAIAAMVEAYPAKDAILKSKTATGSGTPPNGNGKGGSSEISKTLSPVERITAAREAAGKK
jgi:hypothetical protein